MYVMFYMIPDGQKNQKYWRYGSTKEILEEYANEQGLDKHEYGIAIEEWEYRDLLKEIDILQKQAEMAKNYVTGLEEQIKRIKEKYSGSKGEQI